MRVLRVERLSALAFLSCAIQRVLRQLNPHGLFHVRVDRGVEHARRQGDDGFGDVEDEDLHPDLDLAEQFLSDFGMVKVERTATALYMRGTGPSHHIHVTELGAPRVVGLAFEVASAEVLEAFSRLPGASGVESIDEPGGGRRVRLADPNGLQIEIVHGIAQLPPIPVQSRQLNLGNGPVQRAGNLMRVARQPAQVKRIGDPLFGDLRRLAAVLNARLALIPVAAESIGRTEGEARVQVATAIIDALDGTVLWFGITESEADARGPEAGLASVAQVMARQLGGRRTQEMQNR